METFVAHPSIRIKGSEDNYEPILCNEIGCTNHKYSSDAHMHCPFCIKTDAYEDPLLLKAHYRVKHVDKGIDFAGLKILRCCERCEIKGSIKGNKFFKGAHWHCYKCMNGFNRRDEALKHYRTHFRNPDTTFNIQVAQNVHVHVSGYHRQKVSSSSIVTDSLGEFCNDSNFSIIAPTATEETVIDCNGDQTFMVIERPGVETDQSPESRVEELEEIVQNLEVEKEQMAANIANLEAKVAEQEEVIQAFKLREQKLSDQFDMSKGDEIGILISRLNDDHCELLKKHLSQIKSALLPIRTIESDDLSTNVTIVETDACGVGDSEILTTNPMLDGSYGNGNDEHEGLLKSKRLRVT